MQVVLTQRDTFDTSRNERTDSLDRMWIDLLERWGMIPSILPNHFEVAKQIFDANPPQAIILTGGNHLHLEGQLTAQESNEVSRERERIELWLIQKACEKKLPLLGVCRGMQILARYWGHTIERVSGHQRSSHGLLYHPQIEFKLPKVVNSYHHFGVKAQKQHTSLMPIATDLTGKYLEAFHHCTFPQMGLQWHPERKPFQPQVHQGMETFLRSKTCEFLYLPQAVDNAYLHSLTVNPNV